MFKNHAFLVQCVKTPQTETPTEPFEPLAEFAVADIRRERIQQMAKTAAAGFVLVKATDTLCKIAIHTASVKIK